MPEALQQHSVVRVATTGDKAISFYIQPPVPMVKHGILNGTVDTLLLRSKSAQELESGEVNPILQNMRMNHVIRTKNTDEQSQLEVDFSPIGLGTDFIFGVSDMRKILSVAVQTALDTQISPRQ